MGDFLDLKPGTGGSGQRPTTRPGTGAGAAVGAGVGGAAVADFLNRPSTGQQPAGPGAGTRPAPGDRPATRPGTGERPGAGERPGGRPGAGDRPRPGDRPVAGQRPSHRPDKIKNREKHQEWREKRADYVRDRMPPRWDFWKDHPSWARYRWNRPYRWATWAAVSAFFPWGWGQPTYYSYGDNVYYEGDEVYYGDQAVASSEEYAEQAEDLATSAPAAAADAEWMTLGVFAVTQDDEDSAADPTLYVQLAIDKQGIIAGTVHDTATDKTAEVTGMVDKKTQRAAWVVKGKTSPIMETGIFNLTKDSCGALLHFADGQTQQWLLVRMEEPKEGAEAAPAQ